MMWVLWIKKVWNLAMKKCNPDFLQKQLDTCSRGKGSTVVFLENNAAFVGWPHENVLCFPEKNNVDGMYPLCKIKYPGHDNLCSSPAAFDTLAGLELLLDV